MIRAHHCVWGLVLVGAAACSVLNSPDELKPIEDDGAGDAGGTQSTGGSKADGGKAAVATGGVPDTSMPGVGGDDTTGVAGCGQDCSEGGTPPIGRSCTDSAADCGSTAPICDAVSGECRACAKDQECVTETGKNFCVMSGAAAGRCVQCTDDTQCAAKTPVCGAAGTCRACSSDDECSSGLCESTGTCAQPANIVYALAETGIGGPNCGTQDTPCRNLSDAAAKLTATRKAMVLIKTPKIFNVGATTFPAIKGIRVVGNGVKVAPYDGKTGFVVPAGAEVTFDNIVVAGSTVKDTAGIQCTSAAVTVLNSTLQDNGTGLLATDCDVTVGQSMISNNTKPVEFGNAAIKATCTAEHCTKNTTILRNKFLDNGVALYFSNQAKATVENNLFLRNGADGYTRVLELRADSTLLRYNTLVENFNSCTYVGIVACIGSCTNVANISYNNFPGQDCLDQVWYGGTLSYSLTEIAYPGATNKVGDPKFVNAAMGDFTPGKGSPAIDKGDPASVPPFDLNGTKRPVGAAPDIGAIEAQ